MSYRPPKKGKKSRSNLSDDGPIYEPVGTTPVKQGEPDSLYSPDKPSNLISPSNEIKGVETPNTETASSVTESLFESSGARKLEFNPPTENKVLEEPIRTSQTEDSGTDPEESKDKSDSQAAIVAVQGLTTSEVVGLDKQQQEAVVLKESAAKQEATKTPEPEVRDVEVQNISKTPRGNSLEEYEKKSQLSDPHRSREDSGSLAHRLLDVGTFRNTMVYKTAYYSFLQLKVGCQLFSRVVTTA